MHIQCWSCHTSIDLPSHPVNRGEYCPKCMSDVRVCLNCIFFDSQAKGCIEPEAEDISDRTRANYCEYFALKKPPSNHPHITDLPLLENTNSVLEQELLEFLKNKKS